MNDLRDKSYLGDGLYVGHDGFQIWLYTDQGNEVALEPIVLKRFKRYVEAFEEMGEAND